MVKPFYDVIVVGAGSSGLMAAIQAAQQGVSVLLIEKNKRPGRKLLLSGGGRCNVTNRTTRDELIKHIPGNGKFLYSALNQFNQEDIIDFFESQGVALKEEDHGRMFPVTDSARTILDTLLDNCRDLSVDLLTEATVETVIFSEDKSKIAGVQLTTKEIIEAKSVVLAVGGRAYPRTGATGDGYAWAKKAGHTIARLYPTEAPLLSDDEMIVTQALKGVSLRDVNVTVWDAEGKAIVSHLMDMIFTHFGYSGPAILRCSGHVNQYLFESGADRCHLSIDLQPSLTTDALEAIAESQRDKQILTILKQWMPERMAEVILSQLNITATTPFKQLEHEWRAALWSRIKGFAITSIGSQPIEKGFVTGGGVNTKEIEPSSMESKLMPGLFFCGELMDINGYTGGYNITAAFVTGTIAGRHAAWASMG
ncbi:BaiN/RdsA family NAD(P)/FAD-dependent oxidoreductase [Fundicoccus culcitae]|uniref:NAD(P)/FAD-dependent oxidoreductase n=1 Tax=Fundicoccus culcitae TaxID=2969821 RepID=A0ABY5P2S5_9LACT|nr:NAD(P)/FAD-dependent oxidoreductase [Fundicoccus culcitae]UUX32728.1 NAD(P)/FAD-dependent oxidoreductase [Fundicoccus culcitae]